MFDGLISAPCSAAAVYRGRVVPPRYTRSVEFVTKGRVVETGLDAFSNHPLRSHRWNRVTRTAPAAPRTDRIGDRRTRFSCDDVLVRDEAARVEVRRKHLIGKNVVFPDEEVRLRLKAGHVAVRRVRVRALRISRLSTLPVLFVEAVHFAVRSGIRA